MNTWTVGTGGNFATIATAMASVDVLDDDTIELLSGYFNESVTITRQGLTVIGDTSNTGIVLRLGPDMLSITLSGTAPIRVDGNASANAITGGSGNDTLTGGANNDTLLGGSGMD